MSKNHLNSNVFFDMMIDILMNLFGFGGRNIFYFYRSDDNNDKNNHNDNAYRNGNDNENNDDNSY